MNDLNEITQEDWDRYLLWCNKNSTQPDMSDFQRFLDES